jgi:hypothetical protein
MRCDFFIEVTNRFNSPELSFRAAVFAVEEINSEFLNKAKNTE